MRQNKINFRADSLINYHNNCSSFDIFHFKIANLKIRSERFKLHEFFFKFEKRFFQ
jgi:hypothetical protein